jgi:hypothetical protein
MGFKIEKRPEPGAAAKGQARPWHFVAAALAMLLLFWGLKQVSMPDYYPCDACQGTGLASCGAPGCVHGKVPCTGPCLKLDTPGWHHMDVAGHSPDELWMVFEHPSGGWSAWNQSHVGDAIELVDGAWTNTGKCKLCNGTGRMPCPVCHGEKKCPICGGEGKLRNWLW